MCQIHSEVLKHVLQRWVVISDQFYHLKFMWFDFEASRAAYGHKRPIYGHFEPFWGLMAPPDGHSGPGKWSLPTPPDVSSLDPTLIHLDPPFRSLQGCLWLGVPFMALFGQFLAIKWVKMAGSKMAVFGSRPSSTQWTRYMYWFSRNDNFEIRIGD